jgi:hypothetical protein
MNREENGKARRMSEVQAASLDALCAGPPTRLSSLLIAIAAAMSCPVRCDAAESDDLRLDYMAHLPVMVGVSVQSEVSRPLVASHTFSVKSMLPLAIRFPSGLKATLFTTPVWPLSVSWFLLNSVYR